LSGKEAHVAFRSNESQTRELLDASQDQLRDMLGNEGLVLSGVSVGESGARHASGEGGASPRGRATGRVGIQVPLSEGVTLAPSRPGVLTDRAVDVFV
ncbi:MAG: flagellar hook-length control protein FliK, partial [Burkholderiaceae bacterium]